MVLHVLGCAGKKVVESDDDEPSASGLTMDTYEAPTPSPAVARQVRMLTVCTEYQAAVHCRSNPARQQQGYQVDNSHRSV